MRADGRKPLSHRLTFSATSFGGIVFWNWDSGIGKDIAMAMAWKDE